ncbi:MAG: hypothetical protein GY756_08725 [bacterium]|nr:hypothetical protein [bacterium]
MKKIIILTAICFSTFCVGLFANQLTDNWKNVKISPVTAQFIHGMPKTDIHIHLEGSFDPKLAWQFAEKYGYGVDKPLMIPKVSGDYYSVTSEAQLQSLFHFDSLLPFLNMYNALSEQLLRTPQDLTDLASNYMKVCEDENIQHIEAYVDPQFHMNTNQYRKSMSFKTYVDAIQKGFDEGRAKGIDAQVISAITRNVNIGQESDSGDINATNISNPSAWNVVNCTINYNKQITNPSWRILSIGLGGDEAHYPAGLFKTIYRKAGQNGLFLSAHAGEVPDMGSGTVTGPASIWQAVRSLKVDRIGHGIRSNEDQSLMNYLSRKHYAPHIFRAYKKPHKIALTLCPMSNYDLKNITDPTAADTLQLLDSGLLVSINSDDPAYLGGHCGYETLAKPGYVTENYLFLLKVFDPSVTKTRAITKKDIEQMVINGFKSGFLPLAKKHRYIKEVKKYFRTHKFI